MSMRWEKIKNERTGGKKGVELKLREVLTHDTGERRRLLEKLRYGML